MHHPSPTDFRRVPRRPIALLLLLCLGLMLAGCSRNTVKLKYRHPDFDLSDFRMSHSVLVVSNEVETLAFRKSFAARFPVADSFSSYLTREILDSLHHTPALSVRPAPGPELAARLAAGGDSLSPEDRAEAEKQLTALGVRYLVHVRGVTVTSAKKSLPQTFLPGIGGTQPAGGGTSEKCVIYFTVEIRKAPGLELAYAFTVQSSAEADIYYAATALRKAVDGAAQRAAAQLRGY